MEEDFKFNLVFFLFILGAVSTNSKKENTSNVKIITKSTGVLQVVTNSGRAHMQSQRSLEEGVNNGLLFFSKKLTMDLTFSFRSLSCIRSAVSTRTTSDLVRVASWIACFATTAGSLLRQIRLDLFSGCRARHLQVGPTASGLVCGPILPFV